MPLVSVIMNVRNGAATLREAIDSVLAQTFPDWELIVWDDRSTDSSAALVSTYKDPRVRYFLSPDDAPLGKARNDAIQHATGEWIAFLDQDDIWLPHKLEKQIALAGEDVGLIYGRTVRFYPGGWQRDYDHAHEYELLPEGDIFAKLFTQSCFIAMSSAVFRRSALQQRYLTRFASSPITTCTSTSHDDFAHAPCRRWSAAIECTPTACRTRLHSTCIEKCCG